MVDILMSTSKPIGSCLVLLSSERFIYCILYTLTDFGLKTIFIFFTIGLINTTMFLTRIGYKTALQRIILPREENKVKNNRIAPVKAQYYIDEK